MIEWRNVNGNAKGMLSKIAHGRVRMMLKCLFGEVVSKTLAAEMSDVCVYSY